jgi:hypothetical protein
MDFGLFPVTYIPKKDTLIREKKKLQNENSVTQFLLYCLGSLDKEVIIYVARLM